MSLELRTIQVLWGQLQIQINSSQLYTLEGIERLDAPSRSTFYQLFRITNDFDLLTILARNQLMIAADTQIVLDRLFKILFDLPLDRIVQEGSQFGLNLAGSTKFQLLKSIVTTQLLIQRLSELNLGSVGSSLASTFSKLAASSSITATVSSTVIQPPRLAYPVVGEISEVEIIARRKFIHDHLIETRFRGIKDIQMIEPADLQVMFDLYDKYFFLGSLRQKFIETQSNLTFRVSHKPQNVRAAACGKESCNYMIEVSWPIFARLFPTGRETYKHTFICTDRLECLQLSFEHEMIHLAILISGSLPLIRQKKDPIYSPHGAFFKQLFYAYFRQVGSTHDYFSGPLEDQLTRADFRIGDKVNFPHQEKRVFVRKDGQIITLNPKRAQVKAINGIIYEVRYEALRKD